MVLTQFLSFSIVMKDERTELMSKKASRKEHFLKINKKMNGYCELFACSLFAIQKLFLKNKKFSSLKETKLLHHKNELKIFFPRKNFLCFLFDKFE